MAEERSRFSEKGRLFQRRLTSIRVVARNAEFVHLMRPGHAYSHSCRSSPTISRRWTPDCGSRVCSS